MIIVHDAHTPDRDRSEAFHAFARRRADGEVLVPPTLLSKEERRLYVRRTLREDHQFRIHSRPEGAQTKFDKLAGSVFSFFRGTALLYYRDHAGMDGHLPAVFTIGDVHPENFGVMPSEHGTPFFGVNDFDEAAVAPFSYDVKRGATGFFVICREIGFKKKASRAAARAFVEGYLDGLKEFAQDDREKTHQFRMDNSPEMIRELLEDAQESRESFLEDYVDLDKERFIASDEIVPQSQRAAEFQELIDAYRRDNDLQDDDKPEGFFAVKDVAIKKGSGTASLGLDRYFVLLEGPGTEAHDDLILELKQARRSALYGLVPNEADLAGGEAEQVAMAQRVHLVAGDPYYGHVMIDDQSFLVRERSPYKDDIDVDDLDEEEMATYAAICGKALAQPHARSDEDTGIMEGDAERRILSSIQPDVFMDDVVRFAEAAAKRIYKDHEAFVEDHALGAFQFVRRGQE